MLKNSQLHTGEKITSDGRFAGFENVKTQRDVGSALGAEGFYHLHC
jgi:hypothetical protein